MKVKKIVELSGWEVYKMVKTFYPFATGVDYEGMTVHLQDDAPDVTGEEIADLWPSKEEALKAEILDLEQQNNALTRCYSSACNAERRARRECDAARAQGSFASLILAMTTVAGWGLFLSEIL